MIVEGTAVAVGITSASAAAVTLLGVLRDWKKHPARNLIIPDERQGRTYWDFDHAKEHALPIHRLEAGSRVLLEIPHGPSVATGEAFVSDVEMRCDTLVTTTHSSRYLAGIQQWEITCKYVLTSVETRDPRLIS